MEEFSAYLRVYHQQSDNEGHDTLPEESQEVGIYPEKLIHCRIDMEDIKFAKQGKKRIARTRQPIRCYDSIEFLIKIIPKSSKGDADRKKQQKNIKKHPEIIFFSFLPFPE
jgi:hypothetical protein